MERWTGTEEQWREYARTFLYSWDLWVYMDTLPGVLYTHSIVQMRRGLGWPALLPFLKQGIQRDLGFIPSEGQMNSFYQALIK